MLHEELKTEDNAAVPREQVLSTGTDLSEGEGVGYHCSDSTSERGTDWEGPSHAENVLDEEMSSTVPGVIDRLNAAVDGLSSGVPKLKGSELPPPSKN